MKYPVKTCGFAWGSLDCTSAVNEATKTQEAGDTVDCNLINSINSFAFSALMSCPTESSRMRSRVMMIAINLEAPAAIYMCQARTHSSVVDRNLVT